MGPHALKGTGLKRLLGRFASSSGHWLVTSLVIRSWDACFVLPFVQLPMLRLVHGPSRVTARTNMKTNRSDRTQAFGCIRPLAPLAMQWVDAATRELWTMTTRRFQVDLGCLKQRMKPFLYNAIVYFTALPRSVSTVRLSLQPASA